MFMRDSVLFGTKDGRDGVFMSDSIKNDVMVLSPTCVVITGVGDDVDE